MKETFGIFISYSVVTFYYGFLFSLLQILSFDVITCHMLDWRNVDEAAWEGSVKEYNASDVMLL